ncbi:MAG: sulfotransferase family protein [Gammaproteobacteria bacterium]
MKIFIVGAPRSGTTWLQLMLGRLPGLATSQETHLFSNYLSAWFPGWERMKRSKRGVGLYGLFDDAGADELVRSLTDQVFERMAAQVPDARMVLEKTPGHVMQAEAILRLYPDAYMIHLVRDPRSVVASLRAASESWGAHWAPGKLQPAIRLWRDSVQAGRAISERTDRYLELRYEDLMTDASAGLAQVRDFLGEPRDEAWCRSVAEEFAKNPKGSGKAAWDVGKEPEGFFRGAGVEGWRKDLGRGQVAVIEEQCAELMGELGYSCLHANPAYHPAVWWHGLRRTLAWHLEGVIRIVSP